jgi:hypothetical protein
VLGNTFYINAVLGQLRAEGYSVRGEDLVRLSPFVRRHLGVHDRYWFALPDLAGGIRQLRPGRRRRRPGVAPRRRPGEVPRPHADCRTRRNSPP